MNIYQYSGLSIITVIGLFVGWFIAKNTEEELKDGLKYFRILSLAVLFSLILLTLQLFYNLYLSIAISLALIASILYLPHKLKAYTIYGILAIIFSFIMKNSNSYIVPSLIFVHNMSKASAIYYIEKKQAIKKIFLLSILFLILTSIGYFIA